jgi:hypothetical protein
VADRVAERRERNITRGRGTRIRTGGGQGGGEEGEEQNKG